MRLAVAVAVVALLAGCAGKAKPATTPSPAPAASPIASLFENDVAGAKACQMLEKVKTDPDALMTDNLGLNIANVAGESTHDTIVAAGSALADAYRRAIIDQGSEDEAVSKVRLLTAGINLDTECIKAHLDGN